MHTRRDSEYKQETRDEAKCVLSSEIEERDLLNGFIIIYIKLRFNMKILKVVSMRTRRDSDCTQKTRDEVCFKQSEP